MPDLLQYYGFDLRTILAEDGTAPSSMYVLTLIMGLPMGSRLYG